MPSLRAQLDRHRKRRGKLGSGRVKDEDVSRRGGPLWAEGDAMIPSGLCLYPVQYAAVRLSTGDEGCDEFLTLSRARQLGRATATLKEIGSSAGLHCIGQLRVRSWAMLD